MVYAENLKHDRIHFGVVFRTLFDLDGLYAIPENRPEIFYRMF